MKSINKHEDMKKLPHNAYCLENQKNKIYTNTKNKKRNIKY